MYTLYIKTTCPYCSSAVNTLKQLNIKHKVIDVEKHGGKESVISTLKKNKKLSSNSTHNTVPIIFNDTGKFIGGLDNLRTFLKL